MDARRLPPAVLAAASDRAGGALEVAATALDGLLEVADDPELLEEAVAALGAGQPAMAPIWHLAVAARSPDPRSALAALRARLAADAGAAVDAATAWLLDRLAADTGAGHPGAVATVSHSSLVERVLGGGAGACGNPAPRSLGPLHGRVAQAEVEGVGLSTGPVVGVVGDDAIGPAALLNADGTRELAERVPTLVVATPVKLVPAAVFGRLGGAGFEVVAPVQAGRRARELPPS